MPPKRRQPPNGPERPSFRRTRRPAQRSYTAEQFAQRLRDVLVRESWRHSPNTAYLADKAGIPYEVLRHFMTDPLDKHMLCPVNEEKLGRVLGHDSGFYRDVVRRWFRRQRKR